MMETRSAAARAGYGLAGGSNAFVGLGAVGEQ
jgi:hypothetical protein